MFLSLSLIFCSKRCEIKFKTLFGYENEQQKKIKNIAINHSADTDYNDFVRIYRECSRKPYSFLTINTTLPTSDSLKFRKNLMPYKNHSR